MKEIEKLAAPYLMIISWHEKILTLDVEMIVLCLKQKENKAGFTATEVACGWAGAIFEVTRAFGQEQ